MKSKCNGIGLFEISQLRLVDQGRTIWIKKWLKDMEIDEIKREVENWNDISPRNTQPSENIEMNYASEDVAQSGK